MKRWYKPVMLMWYFGFDVYEGGKWIAVVATETEAKELCK